jgi:hypothetical protein
MSQFASQIHHLNLAPSSQQLLDTTSPLVSNEWNILSRDHYLQDMLELLARDDPGKGTTLSSESNHTSCRKGRQVDAVFTASIVPIENAVLEIHGRTLRKESLPGSAYPCASHTLVGRSKITTKNCYSGLLRPQHNLPKLLPFFQNSVCFLHIL